MTLSKRWLGSLWAVLLFSFCQASGAYDLTGTVYGDSNPLPSATVHLYNAGQSPISDTTTNGSGAYSFTGLSDGTYWVNVTPPGGSGYSESPLEQISIAGANAVHTIALLSSGITVSGVVRDHQGNPVATGNSNSIGVRLKNISTGIYYPSSNYVKTAANGVFSIGVPAGTYDFEYKDYLNVSIPDAPQHITRVVKSVVVNGSVQQDIVLPFVELTGRTLDSNGVPVAGVNIAASGTWTDGQGNTFYTQYGNVRYAVSDAGGNYKMLLAPNVSYNLSLVPPAGRADLVSTVINGVNIYGVNLSRDLVVEAGVAVSGVVRDHQGNPVATGNYNSNGVRLKNISTGVYYPSSSYVKTLANGAFSIGVPAGTYDFEYKDFMNLSIPDAPQYITRIMKGVVVSGAVQQDIVLPFVELTGRTLDSNGVPVAGVSIATTGTWTDAQGSSFYTRYGDQRYAVSDANGNYTLLLAPNVDYDITVIPPSGSGFSSTVLNAVHVAGNQTMTIYLQYPDITPPKIISGPLADKIENNSAVINWVTNEPTVGTLTYEGGTITITEPATVHTVAVSGLTPNTTYHFQVNPVDTSANAGVPSAIATVTTKAIADTDLPTLLFPPTVSVNGNSAQVNVEASEPITGVLNYGVGAPAGSNVVLSGLAVTHTLDITGLSPNTIYSYQIQFSDAAGNGPVLSAVYQFTTPPVADTLPPMIISGPIVRDISHEAFTVVWKTNEPAISGVSWNDGTAYDLITDENLVTHHEFRITGLSASTSYNVTVSSTDGHNNGPTLGGPTQVKTTAAPDTTAPCFEEHPVPLSVNHQQAMIRFRVCESASAVVEYGLAGGALSEVEAEAHLKVNHVIKLADLLADTLYDYRVTVKDQYGNATVSNVLQFRTDKFNGAGKSEPKFIVEPTVVASTENTVTLAWETDEPVVAVVEHGAGAAVEQREEKSVGEASKKQFVTIANFEPSESKNIKITISDSDGNKKQHVSAVQSASSGQTAALPVISGLTVTEISNNKALVKWNTDVPADSRIAYAVNGSPLNSKAGDEERATQHSQVLSNLSANTSYRLSATSGNPVNGLSAAVEFVFNTLTSPEVVVPAIQTATATLVDGDTMKVDWDNNGEGRAEIHYGDNAAALNGREHASKFRSGGSYHLKNLDPGKTWYARVVVTDPSGNQSTSALLSVQTTDIDSDGDGVMDSMDAFPADPTEWVDTDGDGIGNNADWDDDNDGIPDVVDADPLDAGNTNEIPLPLDGVFKGTLFNSGSLSQ